MKPFSTSALEWSFRPYRPFLFDRGDIYITRLVPDINKITLYWLTEDANEVTLYYRKRDEGEYISAGVFSGGEAVLDGLEAENDYEFYIEASNGEKSLTRLARTGDYIFTPINYLHPKDEYYSFSGHYLCTPTIIRQSDGSLLASMDVYAGEHPQNLTIIYRSDDEGKTWQWQCELFPCFWGKLFVWHGETYMVGCSTEHGDIIIGKSTDFGRTWCAPTVLFRGTIRGDFIGPDMSAEPPFEYNGRLWLNSHIGNWRTLHNIFVLSAPVDSDILDAKNWTITQPCVYDENWPGAAKGNSYGTLEGTFVTLPDGELYIMARYEIDECTPNYGLAVLYKVRTDDPSAAPEFYRTVPFDGNHSKFTVYFDDKSGYYYTIISRIIDPNKVVARNLLSFVKSRDCINWELVCDLLDYSHCDWKKVGFQYVDWIFNGDDIYYVIRTGINEAASFHDSNTILFSKIKNFREI